ncbi:MAG: TrkA family potassium uptake protein [Candidatus Omnitrophica bacterium]|nr:TrkA family potassium uptake protein [Candidatus Omnitrophota bacterium]MBU4149856.1 TrkA family potassium uptake protein [Candidatus Omnitrophota bacterium]
MRQFAVIGLGRFGWSVAKTLSEKGHQVLAIDRNEELVQGASDFVTESVQVDSTDEKAMKAVGIMNVDVAIIGIGTNLEASILTALILKELGIQHIVARAVTEEHGKVLEKVGATKVVFLERDMGIRVANSLLSPSVLEHIELSPEFSIMETVPPQEFIGKSIRDLDVRAKHGLNIIGVRGKKPKTQNGTCELNVAPKADYIIKQGDIFVIIGSNENLDKFKKAYHIEK